MNKNYIAPVWKYYYKQLNDLNYEKFYEHPGIIATMVIDNQKHFFQFASKFLKELNYISDNFKENSILNPISKRYFNNRKISVATEKWVCRTAEIIHNFNLSSMKNVVEIGSGYGGQCEVLVQLYPKLKYILIDYNIMLNLSKYFLKKHNNLIFIDTEKIEKQKFKNIDLLISNNAFDETTDEYRNIIYKNVFPHVKNLFFVINTKNKGRLREKLLEELTEFKVEEYDRNNNKINKNKKVKFVKVIAKRKIR